MIQAKNSIKGMVNTPQKVEGKINASIIRITPELEDLEVTPSNIEQSFKSEKDGFDNVVVKAIKFQEKSVTPTSEEQTIIADDGYDGLNKVNVDAIKGDTLDVTPIEETQTFSGLYETVNVDAIETEEVEINPDFSTHDTFEVTATEGKYITKATVNKDPNLKPEIILKGNSVYGIEGESEAVGDEELQNKIEELEIENKSLKRELEPYDDFVESEIGNPVCLNDSTDLPCEVYLVGNTKQEITSTIETVGSNVNMLPNLISNHKTGGVTITKNSDGSLTLNGTSTYDIFLNLNNSSGSYFNLINGEEYTISLQGNTWIRFIVRPANQDKTIAQLDGVKKTFTSDYTGACFAYLRIWGGMTFNNTTIYPKIEKGTNETPIYTPYGLGYAKIEVNNGLEIADSNYQSYTKLLQTQKEFAKIGDVADTFVKQNDKWYEQHNIAKIESYNGEAITTEYISTTGNLTTGATVYYVLSTPNLIECTTEQNNILNSFHTYRNKTNISVDGIGTLKVFYKRERE